MPGRRYTCACGDVPQARRLPPEVRGRHRTTPRRLGLQGRSEGHLVDRSSLWSLCKAQRKHLSVLVLGSHHEDEGGVCGEAEGRERVVDEACAGDGEQAFHQWVAVSVPFEGSYASC